MMANEELEERCREAVRDHTNPNWFWKLMMRIVAAMGVIVWLVYWLVYWIVRHA